MDKALGVIGTKCTIASEIGLQGPAISDLGVAALLAAKGSSISTLRIEFCHGITDAAMAAISEHLGDSLVDLSISDCPVSDAGLIQVIVGCPKLNSLSLQFDCFNHQYPASVARFPAPAYHITEATLYAIAENLPELDSLSCDCWGFYRLNSNSLIAIDAFVAIAKACNLSTLSVQHVVADDSLLIALGENCCNLYELSFCTGNGTAVTDVGITALADGCPDIVHLYLPGTSGITDAGMAAVGKHCLNLEFFCPPSNISDTGLEIVLKSCKVLDTISLKHCSALTVASARTLATHGANLIHLRLMGCQWLDDASLFTIAAACKQLASLEIFFSQITNEGLLAVARACEELGYVCLRETLVTQEGIDALKRTLPGVDVRLIGT